MYYSSVPGSSLLSLVPRRFQYTLVLLTPNFLEAKWVAINKGIFASVIMILKKKVWRKSCYCTARNFDHLLLWECNYSGFLKLFPYLVFPTQKVFDIKFYYYVLMIWPMISIEDYQHGILFNRSIWQ